jgi:uncharacterized protein
MALSIATTSLLVWMASVGIRSKANEDRLRAAINQEDVSAIEAIVASGAPVDGRGERNRTALMIASSKGDILPIQRLLARGADINARDVDGRTALVYGLAHPNVVKLLLSSGADPNTYNWYSGTPLMRATAMGYYSSMRLLLKAGAYRFPRDEHGDRAIDIAAKAGDNRALEILKRALK